MDKLIKNLLLETKVFLHNLYLNSSLFLEDLFVSKKKQSKNLRKLLLYGKCESCQKGDFSHCGTVERKSDSKAFVEDEAGVRKWYCNMGCILLQLTDEEIKKVHHGFVVGGLIQ